MQREEAFCPPARYLPGPPVVPCRRLRPARLRRPVSAFRFERLQSRLPVRPGRERFCERPTSESTGHDVTCRVPEPRPPRRWPAAAAGRLVLPAGRLGSRSVAPLANGPSVPQVQRSVPQSCGPPGRLGRPPCGEARRTAVAPLGAWAVSPRHHSQYPGARVSAALNQHKLILRGPAAPASGSQYPYVCARSSGAMIVRDPCPPMQLGLRASVTCWRASAACVRPIRLGPGPVARPDSGLSFPTSAARRPGPSGPTRVSR